MSLYGWSPAYEERLLELLEERRWRLPVRQPSSACWRRLLVPGHACSTPWSSRCVAQDDVAAAHDLFDHVLWLRRGPGRSPWVLLSQPYGFDADRLSDWCRGRGLLWAPVDASPYGHRSSAFVVWGDPVVVSLVADGMPLARALEAANLLGVA